MKWIILISLLVVLLIVSISDALRVNAGEHQEDNRSTQPAGVTFFLVENFFAIILRFYGNVAGLINAVFLFAQNIITGIFLFFRSSVVTTTTTTATTSAVTMAPSITTSVATMATTTSAATTVISSSSLSSTTPPQTIATLASASSTTSTTTISPTTSTTLSTTTATSTSTTKSTTTATTEAPTRVVFVSNETYDGNLGGITGADDTCNTLAMDAGFGGTFLAWLSTEGTSPVARFQQDALPYVLVNDTIFARNFSDLVTNGPLVPLYMDQNGNIVQGGNAWVGTGNDGNIDGPNCANWTSTSAGGFIGNPLSVSDWTSSGGSRCIGTNRIYCFEQ